MKVTRGKHPVSIASAAPATLAAPARRASRRSAAFTLIEVIVTTIILGTGVVAIVAAQQAYHMQASEARRMSTAVLLANEIRELTMNFPVHDPITGAATWGPEDNEPTVLQYDDLDDFDGPDGAGLTFDPPINAQAAQIPNMNGWQQRIIVENVNLDDISAGAAADGSTGLVRMTAIVLFQGPADAAPREITRLSWIKSVTAP